MSRQTPQEKNIRIKMKDFLQQWDNASKKLRVVILERFVKHFEMYTSENNIYRLDTELGEITPLFFSRIMSSFQMNYTKVNLIPNHIECIQIYLKSQNHKQYIERFVNSGGIQLILNVLQNRKKHHSQDLQQKCLCIIKRIIESNSNFKEIICTKKGVDILLDMTVDKNTADDLLYSLFVILKQLCIRNDVYISSIHQSIINCMQRNSDNHKSIKTLLKVLQSTLSFNDDIRVTSAKHQPNSTSMLVTNPAQNKIICVQEEVMNKNNIMIILQLLELLNHQIFHELQNLCNVVCKSRKAQAIILQALISLMNESTDDIKNEYKAFVENVINENKHIFSAESKQILLSHQLM